MSAPGVVGEPMATRGSLALAPAVGVAPAPARIPSPAPAPVPQPAAIAVAAAPAEPPDEAWRAILERVRANRPALASVLEHALPLEVSSARVLVGFAPGDAFLAARASEPESLEALTREVRAHFGSPTHVALDLSAKAASSGQGAPATGQSGKQRQAPRSVAAIDAERRSAEVAEARARVEGHPLVQEAIRLFGAQLRDVKLPSGEA
jgi:DNA polymerase-3 subunit gamma/tau